MSTDTHQNKKAMIKVTAYKDIYEKRNGHHIPITAALSRIREGKSREKILAIRSTADPSAVDQLKKSLPSICFSGTFSERFDNKLIEHSGYICCDLDDIPHDELQDIKQKVAQLSYVYAVWISPRGNGLKFLVRIAKPEKHREHFAALTQYFQDISGKWDGSSVNESRVCFESWDEDIIIKDDVKPFTEIYTTVKEVNREIVDGDETFKRLLTWLTNKGKSFASGERNNFLFRLASACCRFGISEENCFYYCDSNFISGQSDFTKRECKIVIASAYRANASKSGSATFDKDVLVEKKSMQEVSLETPQEIYDETIRPADVIFADDVQDGIMSLYNNGYERLEGIGVREIDTHYKMKRGELTLLSGIGNMGKSQINKWMLLMHAVLYNRRFAIFAPEDNPAEEFYNDLIEIVLGADCVYSPEYPGKPRPTLGMYMAVREWVNDHFIFIHPEKSAPTPEYIRERFLELIIKKRVDGCIIDPWNQLTNNYELYGGRDDKYLEVQLAEFARFAQQNEVYMIIVAHPKSLKKVGEDYPCPDVFDLAGGAMWNNKCHNILIYHRPHNCSDVNSPVCEFHAKKIKKQKVVGKKGFSEFKFDFATRRYVFENNRDPMAEAVASRLSWAIWEKPYPKYTKHEEIIHTPLPANDDEVPF
jgi:hypothetical protein